ncbi:uncharacterized protein LY89DRAFT_784012 [Mollisia scopiformis]|uniref:Uncharacterized protein n=1 Tax=Mollisia scopiformis TaxID=149040 RepID=A0A194X464_MOLSC|nr:uncharacterized protein LY89DRAFT_784012 [Mollisia scopiformis]KUJ14973.1 hypothetical protein LY89DRAFT_784012 [Mollisia scopiformis]
MASVPGSRKTSNMKTYSRRVNGIAEGPPTKKRRLDESSAAETVPPAPQFKKSSIQNYFKPLLLSSSPPLQSPLPSSDAIEPASTPPSSPPPAIPSSPPDSKPLKKRRLKTRPVLQPIENGSVKVEKNQETNSKLSQMRLDLGQQVYEECSVCHYYYDRSDPTDRKAHDKYHDFHTNNVQPKTEDPKVVLWEENIDDKHHSIRAICRTSSSTLKEGFVEAFSATYQDMGGEGIDELNLWSEIKNPHDTTDERKVPRYKGYMYLVDRHPVSILLVERIKSAIFFPFKDTLEVDEAKGKPQDVCKMSVDRIWTRSSHRRKGYATRLVDIARSNFISGLALGKKDVAFTSTTQDGGRFAKSYCKGLFEGAEYLMTLS